MISYIKCPLIKEDYLPFSLQYKNSEVNPKYSTALKVWDSAGGNGTVIFFHGSGDSKFPSDDSYLAKAFTDKGYRFAYHLSFGGDHEEVSDSPYIGYGQVANPITLAGGFILPAIGVERAIQALSSSIDTGPIYLVGHSYGAAGVLAHASMRNSFSSHSKVYGCVCSAPTAAGLGGSKFNGQHRVASSLSLLLGGLNDYGRNKIVVLYGDNDGLAPQWMVNGIRMGIGYDSDVVVSTLIGKGHNWIGPSTVGVLTDIVDSMSTDNEIKINGEVQHPGRGVKWR